jgi:acetylglutamate kinase
VVVAVFAGLVNKRIVAAINAAGASAVGLCGADGRILECRLAAPELGFVGDPVAVHPEAILALRVAGIVPVISPIGYVPGKEADQLVNVNADTVAGNIAAALGARRLVFLTDVVGVRGPDGSVLPTLTGRESRRLISEGVIGGGMIPKVEACLHAVGLGVTAQIVDGRVAGALAASNSSGTTFMP